MAGAFPKILLNFSEELLYWTVVNGCFWNDGYRLQMCKIYTEVGWKYISLDYIRNQDLHQSKQINMNSNNSNSDKKKKEKNAFLS